MLLWDFFKVEGVKTTEIHCRVLAQDRREHKSPWSAWSLTWCTQAHADTAANEAEHLSHFPYSPDLVASNHCIFGPLKRLHANARFTSNDEVEEVVHTWFGWQLKSFFSQITKMLVERYKKYTDLQEDCGEEVQLFCSFAHNYQYWRICCLYFFFYFLD